MFPGFELEELPAQPSRPSTPVIEYEDVGYSSPVSSATHSVRLERDDDVWSTIAIASIAERDEIAQEDVAGEKGKDVQDVMKRRLTIEKIAQRGPISRKQKMRKQTSSSSSSAGTISPSKTKRFFNSIKHVFRSKSKKSSPLAAIELFSNTDSPDGDVELSQQEESSETVVQTEHSIAENTMDMSESTTIEEQTTLTTQLLPSPLPTIQGDDSLRGEDKENVMPSLTSPVLPSAATPNDLSPIVILGDDWQDKNIVVKRPSSPPHSPPHLAIEMKTVPGFHLGVLPRPHRPRENGYGETTQLGAMIYFKNAGAQRVLTEGPC